MSHIVADLHIHSTRSDGSVDPADIPVLAAERGLSAVSITDHDQLPQQSDPVVIDAGVVVLSGIELRVDAGRAGRVDLLGYGVRRTEALEAVVERLQENRIERAAQMRGLLEDELGVSLQVPLEEGVGRPHLAAAVAMATDLSVKQVFERYIGDGGPCYVPRRVPTFTEGRSLLSAAGTAVVLAHPLRYDDPAAALALLDRLDGVEVAYPYTGPVDRTPLDAIIEDSDLLLTGGSDAHDADAIGRCGLNQAAFRELAPRLGLSMD